MKLLSIFTTVAIASAQSCPPAHSPDAEVWNGIIGTNVQDQDAARTAIKEMNLDPNLSKCVGSLDLSMVDAIALISDNHCMDTMNQVMPNFSPPFNLDTTLAPRYQKVLDDLEAMQQKNKGDTVGLIADYEAYLVEGLTKGMYEDITDLIRSKVSHCIHNSIIPLVFKHMFDLETKCCDDFKADYLKKTLQTWNLAYTRMAVNKIGDLLFTTNGAGESCAKSVVRAAMGRQNLAENLQHFLSLPNSMACPAALGENFKSHVNGGEWHQYFDAINCCSYNIQSIVEDIKEFPIAQELLTPAAFAQNDYDCADAASLPVIQDALASIEEPKLKEYAEKFVQGLCIHLANGSGECAGAGYCTTVSSFFN